VITPERKRRPSRLPPHRQAAPGDIVKFRPADPGHLPPVNGGGHHDERPKADGRDNTDFAIRELVITNFLSNKQSPR
jgi:hypothetical protein